jgi:hypothetical protein
MLILEYSVQYIISYRIYTEMPPRRVKIPVEMQEADPEPDIPAVEMKIVDASDTTPPASPTAPPAPPKPTFNPDAEAPPPAVKPKRIKTEKQLAALALAREKARDAAAARRALKEGVALAPEAPAPEASAPEPKDTDPEPPREKNPLPPVSEEPPPPPPKAPAKKTKAERDAEKADKAMAAAKAKALKQMSAPVKKAPKQISVDEKASKENARRMKEGEAMKKAEFDARVARQVQAELRRQKAMEKLEQEEREEREEKPTPRPSVRAPQNTVLPQQPKPQVHFQTKPKPNAYEFMHNGEPAYVRMQKRGDSFMDRLMDQMQTMNTV